MVAYLDENSGFLRPPQTGDITRKAVDLQCPARRVRGKRSHAHLPVNAPLLSLRSISKRFVQRVDLAGKLANAIGAGVPETDVQ
ncbi:MAG: hypothetical protein ACXVB2_18465, partial [Isosphaeraceae bacterium]